MLYCPNPHEDLEVKITLRKIYVDVYRGKARFKQAKLSSDSSLIIILLILIFFSRKENILVLMRSTSMR